MEPIQILATLAALGGLLAKVVEAVRRKAPWLSGLAVMATAWAIGAGLAWAIDLRATVALLEAIGGSAGRIPPIPVDYVITGAAIAAWSGFFADLVNRTGVNAPSVTTDRVLVDAGTVHVTPEA